jgi:hypothetical protein
MQRTITPLIDMAYYNYKVVRDMIPDDFRDAFIKEFEADGRVEYDGDANYDGHMWLLVAEYIEHLQEELERKEGVNGSTTN